MSSSVMPGCEPLSHRCGSSTGVVVVHGFTGTPSSVRNVAEVMIAAGHDVELPRLPGHGTVIDDMLDTGWSDWYGEVDRVTASLAERVERVVLVGQSVGGTLALAAALERPSVAGVVCINPVTRPRDETTMAMVDEFIADGLEIVPGEGSDIADPDSSDITYGGTPLRPLRSLIDHGVVPITDRFAELAMPLRLFTSRHDHVVPPTDSEHLAASWGGPVEHTWLERSYHVATRDYERDVVIDGTVRFVDEVTS
jgi:carboxylesterase